MPSRRTRLAAVVAAALAIGALVPSSPADADPSPPTWTAVPVPVPTAANGDIEAVGCAPGAALCVEVGLYHDTTGRERPLIAHRTTDGWRQDPVPPLPADTATSGLTAVGCASADACIAVGSVSAGDFFSDRPLAYSWNGTRWARATLELPDGAAAGRLTGASCGTPTACMAVGDMDRLDGGRSSVSYTFDGSTWTARTVPVAGDPSFPIEGLHAVSCATASACTAVGDGFDPAGIILSWNGATWQKQTPSPVAGAYIGELDGVSCPTATSCTAVGYVYSGADDTALVQRLTARGWVRETVPAEISGLTGVACASASTCVTTAVESHDDKYEVGVATRSGGRWSYTPLPGQGDYTRLTGLACTATDTCLFVGDDDTSLPFAERRVGTTWTSEASVAPRGVLGSHLHGVSCAATTACTAVGRYTTTRASLGLVERWDGRSWTRQTLPDRARTPFTDLLDVSCPTVTSCFAAGQAGSDPDGIAVPEPLLMQWNPSGWTTVSSPSPAGTEGSVNAVSCASATSCVAVGYSYASRSGAIAYVLRGTTWTSTSITLPTDMAVVDLTGVSCSSATSCHAVGSGFTRTGEPKRLDLVWDGSAWSVGPAIGPVDAVSCAADSCVAVGDADLGDQHVVVDVLRGGTWSPRPTPGSATKDPRYLAGISCVSATCEAVGSHDGAALVMRSEPGQAWRLEAAAATKGPGGLEKVSCATAGTCVAVGTFGPTGVLEVRS